MEITSVISPLYPNRKHLASAFVSDLVSRNYCGILNNPRMENRIKEFRTNRGLSLDGLASRIGTTRATIMKLEKGDMRLTTDWMVRISAGLHCTPEELMAGVTKNYSLDEDLMQSAAKAIQAAAISLNKKLDLAQAMAHTVSLYKHVKEYRMHGENIEPTESNAALILKSSAN